MPDIFDKPQRRGASGRVPDSRADGYQKFENKRYTCPPDLYARLVRYAEDNERAKGWVIQKALDAWLTSQGY